MIRFRLSIHTLLPFQLISSLFSNCENTYPHVTNGDAFVYIFHIFCFFCPTLVFLMKATILKFFGPIYFIEKFYKE